MVCLQVKTVTFPCVPQPGRQVFNGKLTEAREQQQALKLLVPAGCFVIMVSPSSRQHCPSVPALLSPPLKCGLSIYQHQNVWHRGTKELLGARRIMLKVIYDRTSEPRSPR